MPRVYRYKTRARTKHADRGYYTCSKCGQDILPGQERYEWSFRYGGTYRRHVSCGMPRQSELTQSKMAQVYAATEAVEDILGDGELGDIESALDQAADEVEAVVEEYREAAEHFGGEGENAERASELEAYADRLRDAGRNLPEKDNYEDEEQWREAVESEVTDAISECPY